jgi:hypothetical protein
MKDQVLQEAKKLHDQGWSILWIRPREKRPVNAGWTTGERTPWAELEKAYKPGYNVGVRTGAPSIVGTDGYLCCIDLDIKDPTYIEAAEKRLAKLIGVKSCPEVTSGGGNGSRHLYGVTKAPFKMVTVEKHPGKWELCIYSTGRQMVLPPSVHPSGRTYEWLVSVEDNYGLPVFDFSDVEARGSDKSKENLTIKEDFGGFEDVDLALVPVSSEITKMIALGEGVIDRSASLLRACSALLSAGLTRDEVLSVLTNQKFFLGRVGYEHTGSESRKRAAQWIWQYTLKGVEEERSAKRAFERAADVEPVRELGEDEIRAQNEEFRDRPEERGFYSDGRGSAKIPDYEALLSAFEKEFPFKTVADMKTVFIFNGTHYENLTPIEIKNYAEAKMNPRPSEKIRAEFFYKVLANHVVRRDFFLRSTDGRINFKNGVLDLESNVLLPHSKDFGFRGVLPFNFDPVAKCPIFHHWIEDVMLGDVSLVSILQEFMGYVIRGG